MIVGEVFLAILFGYDGDESEVVAPHKMSQVVIVAMSEKGAMRQGLVEERRGGLRGFLSRYVLMAFAPSAGLEDAEKSAGNAAGT